MTATLTIFEHEAKAFDWTDRDLVALERLRKRMGVEVLRATVQGGQHVLKAAQHVGVVRLGSRTIQVLPKIYRVGGSVDERQRTREATHNLLHLLAYAGQLQVQEHTLAGLLRRDEDWFEILTRLFALHLKAEWQRGAHRGYTVIEEELMMLKGKWRVADQLRRLERQHIFAVAHDEFTADNSLNRIFRYVVERLWRLSRDAENRQLLGNLREWMDGVLLPPVVKAEEASPLLLTRLNRRYAPLLNLARLFLEGGALQLAAGDVTAFAFVFDMNQLFESFVINFIRRHREAILPLALQDCELLPQSQSAARYVAERDGRPAFRLRPDLAFRGKQGFPLLIDLKYKWLDAEVRTSGIAQSDFYQMFVYAQQYGCRRVLLLYPQTADLPQAHRAQFAIVGGDKVIEAATLDLRVSLSKPEDRQVLIEELKEILSAQLGRD